MTWRVPPYVGGKGGGLTSHDKHQACNASYFNCLPIDHCWGLFPDYRPPLLLWKKKNTPADS